MLTILSVLAEKKSLSCCTIILGAGIHVDATWHAPPTQVSLQTRYNPCLQQPYHTTKLFLNYELNLTESSRHQPGLQKLSNPNLVEQLWDLLEQVWSIDFDSPFSSFNVVADLCIWACSAWPINQSDKIVVYIFIYYYWTWCIKKDSWRNL